MQNNVSTCVGNLIEGYTHWAILQDEEYYFATITIDGYNLSVVVSKYFYEAFVGSRVLVRGFVRKTRKKVNGKKAIFTYFYIIHMEYAEEEDADCRYVEIEGKFINSAGKVDFDPITSNSKYYFEMEYSVVFAKPVTVLAPCRAYATNARKLLSIKKGDRLKVCGLLMSGARSLFVSVKHFELLPECDQESLQITKV